MIILDEAPILDAIDLRILKADEGEALERVSPDVFDGPVDPRWAADFLADPRHHLAVAIDDGRVVGMASAVHYVHPDKAPELWINEVGVTPSHQGRGLGKRLIAALLDHGRGLGCASAWVLTDRDNGPARRLYEAAGGHEAPGSIVMYEFPIGPEDGPATSGGPDVG